MKFEQRRDTDADVIEYKLTITGGDMAAVELLGFDKLLLRECETSGKISDKLLALETLARRIEEGA